ncbi:MAG TPA: response regulator [Nevskiaceae bacterium]|nr:response regulator [Nevskiaceae bacterium]
MNDTRTQKPFDILLVEDSASDALMAREALAAGGLPHALHVVSDGIEAIAFLRREGGYADAPRPSLIYLDLNMPRKSGREVLAEIKADPDLRDIPVVVLTTSSAEKDINEAYRLHANAYMIKALDFDQFVNAITCAQRFWFDVVALPG